MKLILAVVQDQDAGPISDALVAKEHRVTRINTYGGFLKRGNATLLIGVEDEQVLPVIDVIREFAVPREADGDGVSIGAGTIFVLGVRDYVRV